MSPEDKDPAPTKGRASKRKSPSQLMEFFFHMAGLVGFTSDRDIAELAGVSVENVSNWRMGSVKEFKPQKLRGIKEALSAHIEGLKEQAGAAHEILEQGLSPLEIEVGSGPADLQREFRDRVAYDYLGHRFLYYEPMGALAWENLIKRGYEQGCWLAGVEDCCSAWLDMKRDEHGKLKGPIAEALGLSGRASSKGLDVVSLGPGEGEKEHVVLRKLLSAETDSDRRLSWLYFAPVDVSIPLLLGAGRGATQLLGRAENARRGTYQVKSFCADFEEGPLTFLKRLPSARRPDAGVRLVLMLGNTFGNLRDEEHFVHQKLWSVTRPGDLLWLEVGLRMEPVSKDPLYRMIDPKRELTAAEANRRLLLEGPYRRWEAATGRRSSALNMRIWPREDDDASRVPGSLNFCHDLVIKDENRVCTMLYSRRYKLEELTAWLEQRSFSVLRIKRVEDSARRARVAHVLLKRTA